MTTGEVSCHSVRYAIHEKDIQIEMITEIHTSIRPVELAVVLPDPDVESAVVAIVRQLKCTSGSSRKETGPVLALLQGSL